VAESASRFVIIVDASKLCESLGPSFPLPVEVTPFGHQHTLRRIGQLPSLAGSAAAPKLRQLKTGGLYTTDNGNYIIDVACGKPIADPIALAAELSRLTGVVAHGLFNQMASEVIVAGKDGVSVIKSGRQ
jgi:ribose 5-phosphate isomerase A